MTGSPELSMVLEKAIILLNGKEFSALRRILAEYEATEIDIDTFADCLLQLIKDLTFFYWLWINWLTPQPNGIICLMEK